MAEENVPSIEELNRNLMRPRRPKPVVTPKPQAVPPGIAQQLEDLKQDKLNEAGSDTEQDKRRRRQMGTISGNAKGGYVHAADGCAQRGKTKGRMI